jgi:hypothetical protein
MFDLSCFVIEKDNSEIQHDKFYDYLRELNCDYGELCKRFSFRDFNFKIGVQNDLLNIHYSVYHAPLARQITDISFDHLSKELYIKMQGETGSDGRSAKITETVIFNLKNLQNQKLKKCNEKQLLQKWHKFCPNISHFSFSEDMKKLATVYEDELYFWTQKRLRQGHEPDSEDNKKPKEVEWIFDWCSGKKDLFLHNVSGKFIEGLESQYKDMFRGSIDFGEEGVKGGLKC